MLGHFLFLHILLSFVLVHSKVTETRGVFQILLLSCIRKERSLLPFHGMVPSEHPTPMPPDCEAALFHLWMQELIPDLWGHQEQYPPLLAGCSFPDLKSFPP